MCVELLISTVFHAICMSYYITEPGCCLMCVELLISTVFCFTGSSFSYCENEDPRSSKLGLRSSFSRVYCENEDRVLALRFPGSSFS